MDWLPHFNILNSLSWLAQTPTEVELLKSQIQFLEGANASLQEANASLAKTFEHYVNMVKLSLGVAGGIVGIVAILGTVVSIKSLKDYYATLKNINSQVRKQVNEEIAIALQIESRRLNRFTKLLAREGIPERIALDYIVPAAAPRSRPKSLNILLKVLEGRGFSPLPKFDPTLQFPTPGPQSLQLKADVVVLDLQHGGIDRDLETANTTIHAVAARIPHQQAALVVYGRERFYEAVAELNGADEYCGASNSPLSLVARVLEAAYVVDALA